MEKEEYSPHIIIVGLGYVGLPLAIELAKHFPVLGFDINENRIKNLKQNYDWTLEITKEQLSDTSLRFAYQFEELKIFLDECARKKSKLHNHFEIKGHSEYFNSNETFAFHSKDNQTIFIVSVPTPVTADNLPDISPLEKASETIAKVLTKGSIVVYESTVYPGVTEELCGPILEKISGLKAGIDFYLGYSPERVNTGDKEHTLKHISKVVSGQTDIVASKLAFIYGKINNDNIFIAKNIKTAEAAKVIENAQRDINIAFINEIAIILDKLGLSTYDVLEAAETKWNFLKFKPGLVGGHCISVDPYYLAFCARALGVNPEVILSGRHTNESMALFLANAIHHQLIKQNLGTEHKTRILFLGLTFKENIPDLRNTKAIDVINALQNFGYEVDVHDPMADPAKALANLKVSLLPSLQGLKPYDCVFAAVSHQEYLDFSSTMFQQLLKPQGLLADFKNMWKGKKLPRGIRYWTL